VVNKALAKSDADTLAFDRVVAQGGLLGNPADIKLSPADGRLYIASATQNRIARFDTTTGVLSSFLLSTQLGTPVGLAFDAAGDLYVAGFAADKISRVGRDGVFLGNYVAPAAGGLDGPQFLTFIPEPTAAAVAAGGVMLASQRSRRAGSVNRRTRLPSSRSAPSNRGY
jgi:DNA-binding beta-propeller fold protein YncE